MRSFRGRCASRIDANAHNLAVLLMTVRGGMRTWVIRNIGGVMTVQQLSEFESDLPAASPFSQWLDELDLTDQKVRILFYLRKVLEDIHLTRCEKILNILCQKEEEDK